MKKNILYTMLFALVALVMTSCGDKKSEGLSRFTYYPTMDLKGESYMVWDKGTPFVDPGYTSELNGEDVTGQVTVSGNVDVNTSGIYTLTYTSTKNSDGFDASASRTVVVLDPNSAIEGFYLNQASSNRNGTAFGRDFEVLVIDNGDGTITTDDVLGGWYCQRAGYGTRYAMTATIGVNDDGTLELVDSYVPGWGDGLDSFEGVWDAENGIINFVCVYAGSLQFTETWVKE
jgi:hypothetical protein